MYCRNLGQHARIDLGRGIWVPGPEQDSEVLNLSGTVGPLRSILKPKIGPNTSCRGSVWHPAQRAPRKQALDDADGQPIPNSKLLFLWRFGTPGWSEDRLGVSTDGCPIGTRGVQGAGCSPCMHSRPCKSLKSGSSPRGFGSSSWPSMRISSGIPISPERTSKVYYRCRNTYPYYSLGFLIIPLLFRSPRPSSSSYKAPLVLGLFRLV